MWLFMRKILFKIYLLFFFVGIAQPILSQSPYYYYKQLGIKEGLYIQILPFFCEFFVYLYVTNT